MTRFTAGRIAAALLIGGISAVAVPTANAAQADPPVRFCRAATSGTTWGAPFRCYEPPICYSGNVGARFSPIYELPSTVAECRYGSDYRMYTWFER